MQAAFEQTVYPIVTQYCVTCHAGTGPGSPHIASSVPATAYQQTWYTQKVSLASPSTSRLVRRLAADSHYCWSDCAADGAQMQLAIEQWATLVNFGGGGGGGQNVNGIVSQNLTLADGFEDQGADRYADNLIAFWDFKEGSGSVAHDTSGVAPAIDLALEGPTLMTSYGVRIETGRAIGSQAASKKLYDILAEPRMGRGWGNTLLLPGTLGYVGYLYALPIIVGSIPLAKFGASLAHRTHPAHLQTIFAGFLFIVSAKMLFF